MSKYIDISDIYKACRPVPVWIDIYYAENMPFLDWNTIQEWHCKDDEEYAFVFFLAYHFQLSMKIFNNRGQYEKLHFEDGRHVGTESNTRWEMQYDYSGDRSLAPGVHSQLHTYRRVTC